ncbi:hypothetical protein YK48G_24190 [Lentilactobacillus fungorum]|uniref:DUF3397 domain-containing protein n=1 Tax=Lentilactobacillus fungorum TaxID=2201250 RepID=A0ABQ3W6U0_9LACO|nr:DUF3397 domain-containing protein [Lentilactobacillus fungorum]GHP14994.1 hypothetical protein YK48G_24190 [Lentilactobacillus fungorum]
MHLYPWLTATGTFIFQFFILLMVALLTRALKKWLAARSRVKLSPLDFWPPLLLVFIHQLSQNGFAESYIPEVVIVWLGICLIVLLWRIFSDETLTYKKFFVFFWRFSDLFLFVCWFVVAIDVIIQKF